MKKHDRVNVYYDHFTVSDLEGSGTVLTTPQPAGDNDDKGRPLYRAVVQFDGELPGYFRTISELAS